MSDFSVVDPDQIPPIAVASMDAKHHEEVELVNQVGRLIKAGQSGELDSEALHAKLDEWIEHTRRHFVAYTAMNIPWFWLDWSLPARLGRQRAILTPWPTMFSCTGPSGFRGM